jgi:MoxR-like ATPase
MGAKPSVEDPKLVAERILTNVEQVIVGKQRELRLAITALLCGGHMLIEDVPGVGKTMLARAIAVSTGCTFRRIQFTPDLLPSDVSGVSIYNQKTEDFEFRPGPIIAQIVLADEINRATPKTQSALLEAQLDRFLIRIYLGYPGPTDEVLVLDQQQSQHPIETLQQVTDQNEIVQVQKAVREIYVDPLIKQYIVQLSNATREHEAVYLGASPRGSLSLFRTAQAKALLEGRDFVTPDDVKELALFTLAHRIIVSPGAKVKGMTQADVVAQCLSRVPVPGARAKV